MAEPRRAHRRTTEPSRGYGRTHTTVGQRDVLLLASRPQGLRKSEFWGADRRKRWDQISAMTQRKAIARLGAPEDGIYYITEHGRELLALRYASARCATCGLWVACTMRPASEGPDEGKGCQDWEEIY